MLLDFLIPLIVVFLAEIGDKTQLSILLLSTKTKKKVQLFLGVMLAFFLVDGIAIVIGSWMPNLVPIYYLKILSSVIFIIFGLFILLRNEKNTEKRKIHNTPLITGFLMIFLAEWGDKTQIASGIFASQYNIVMVFFGTILALALVSGIAIYLGDFVSKRIDEEKMNKISGVVFLIIGISFLFI